MYLFYLVKSKKETFRKLQVFLIVFAVLYFVYGVVRFDKQYNLFNYYFAQSKNSSFIDDNYVYVAVEDVVFPDKKRNVVLILLESVENTFNEPNLFAEPLMPHLAQLQNENISFTKQYQVSGTSWSIAGITAYMFGIPLKLPSGMYRNNMSRHQKFLPNATSVLDILEANDYRIVMTKGSLAAHAGTDKLFLNHAKNTEIYDYQFYIEHDADARLNPNIWRWGLPDKYIYSKTKKYFELIDVDEKPFFLMLVTVDTHTTEDHDAHVYTEKRKYGDRRDAFMAADDMVYDFLSWLKAQDFYDNTTIIIIGDHLLMSVDMGIVKLSSTASYKRDIYNVVLNSAIQPDYSGIHEREFASFDLAPTILEAIGAKLPKRKFGLGTSLFSNNMTLLEKYGIATYEAEIIKRSKLYNSFH